MDNKNINLSSIHYKLSKAYENYNIGDYDETITWCSDILRQMPECSEANYICSLAYYKLTDFKKAKKYVDIALNISNVRNQLVDMLSLKIDLHKKLNDTKTVKAIEKDVIQLKKDNDKCFTSNLNSNSPPNYPGMIINSLPKSGSMYLWYNLSMGLGIKREKISLSLFKYDQVIPERLERFVNDGNQVVQEHIFPSRLNLLTLKQYNLNKMVIHVRDPRQALISWLYMLDKKGEDEKHTVNFALAEMDFPEFYHFENYKELPLETKIDLLITYYYPIEINWIKGWVDAAQLGEFNLLFTEFVDMKTKPIELFHKILKFYDIDVTLWEPYNLNTAFHFRKGLINEWETLLSPQQINRVNQQLPWN